MNILAINGSHRGENGLTQILIDKLFVGAKNEGASCESVILSKKKINLCKGCRICQTSNSYLKCIYEDKDDIKEILGKISESDIVIYATPIYIFNMSGLMKIFLERVMSSTADSSIRTLSNTGLIFHHINKKIASKPFVLLTCQDNFENETFQNVVDYFRIYSRFLDAPFVGSLNRKSGQFILKQSNGSSHVKVDSVLKAYIKAGEELAKYGSIIPKTLKRANENVISIPKIIEFMLGIKKLRNNKMFMNKILEKAK